MILSILGNSINKLTSLNGRAPPQLTRFFRYTSVGTFSFSLDLILLYLITEFLGVHYLVSATLAFILANTLNYLINRSWGFKQTKQKFIKGYVYLMTINVSSLILIIAFMAVFVELLSINYMISRILVGIIIGIYNFALNSKITFKTSILKKE